MPEDWEEEYYEDDYWEDEDSLWNIEEQEYYINVLEPQIYSLNGRD